MPLGEFSIICFEFFSEFWRKSKKKGKWESGQNGPLRCSEGHPRRGEVLRRNEGLPHRGEAEGQKGHPRVHCSVPVLRLSEALRCSIAVLPAAKTLIIMIKFRILILKVSHSCTDCLGTLINDQLGFK